MTKMIIFTEILNACSAPPEIPHAIIVHREDKEVFVAFSKVQYECEDGYTAEEAGKKNISCIDGKWTEGPTCSKWAICITVTYIFY